MININKKGFTKFNLHLYTTSKNQENLFALQKECILLEAITEYWLDTIKLLLLHDKFRELKFGSRIPFYEFTFKKLEETDEVIIVDIIEVSGYV